MMNYWKMAYFNFHCKYCGKSLIKPGIRGMRFRYECNFCQRINEVSIPLRDEKQNKVIISLESQLKILSQLNQGKNEGYYD